MPLVVPGLMPTSNNNGPADAHSEWMSKLLGKTLSEGEGDETVRLGLSFSFFLSFFFGGGVGRGFGSFRDLEAQD